MNEDDQMEKPAPVEEGTEDVVLTRWEKLKKWFEIAMATKKLYMFVMSLIIGTTGVTIHDQLTNSTTFKDAAEEIGLIDPDEQTAFDPERDIETDGGAYVTRAEWKLIVGHFEAHEHDSAHEHKAGEVVAHTHGASTHEHEPVLFQHQHTEVAPHDHSDAPHKHADHIHSNHTHPEIEALKSQISTSQGASNVITPLPDVLSDAFKQHIKEDH